MRWVKNTTKSMGRGSRPHKLLTDHFLWVSTILAFKFVFNALEIVS